MHKAGAGAPTPHRARGRAGDAPDPADLTTTTRPLPRPVTLFTGQWADLPLETLAKKAKEWGFDGLELACERMLSVLPTQLPPATVQAFGLQAPRLHQGLLLSGDRFVDTTAECRALQAELPDALAVEMEGAAMAQVCHDLGVPLAVVRTISDRADDSAHVDFPRFLREVASRYSAATIEALFTSASPACGSTASAPGQTAP